MDEIAKLRRELAAATQAAAVAKHAEQDLRQRLAEATCPYHVGQITTERGGRGGKLRRCQIIRVGPPRWSFMGEPWGVDALVFKKDGTLSKIKVCWGPRS